MSTRYQATCDTCGYTGTYRSQAQADYAFSKHNCAKHQAWRARAAKHAARMAQVDRTPKPCHHKQANHQHGTNVAYVADRCRCTPCAHANAAYESQRVRLHAYGRFDQKWISADDTRAHIEQLKAYGMGLRTIAARAGVSESTLGKIIYGDPSRGRGPTRRVRHDTAARIAAVRPDLDTLADGARIPSAGSARRLQALMTVGWSQSRLADLLDMNIRNFPWLVHGRRDLTAAKAKAVRDLYEQLWNMPPVPATRWEQGSISRAKSYARARGFAPPLAWDDETIDDPAARPAGVGKRRLQLTAFDLAAEVEHHLTNVDRMATTQQIKPPTRAVQDWDRERHQRIRRMKQAVYDAAFPLATTDEPADLFDLIGATP